MLRYLTAMSTFKAGVGPAILYPLIHAYPQIFSDDTETIRSKLKQLKIKGIAEKRIAAISETVPKFVKELYTLNDQDIHSAIQNYENKMRKLKTDHNPKISGKTFVITGFMMSTPQELEEYIWDNFGRIANKVDSSVTAVIANNIANISGKMVSAQSLGIPIYTKEEFIRSFNVPAEEVNIKVDEEMMYEA